MADNKVPLKQLFGNLQRQMAAQLATSRECIPHDGTKGDASEDCWRSMLCTYLPKRYGVEKAFVVDCHDHCSDQIDIVIFDRQYSPFIFNQSGVKYIPAESVYAVIEAKQEMNKGFIEYAAAKAASVRKLTRTNSVFNTASGMMRKPYLFEIEAGIVATGSGWNPPLGSAFEDVIRETAQTGDHRLDFGCSIDGGSFSVKYEVGKRPAIDKCDSELALVTFFWGLVARLQAQGTASAIDVSEYFKALC